MAAAEVAPVLPQEILRKKRDGAALDDAEIAFFVDGLTRGTIADAQVGAFAMAVVVRGMTRRETVALTRAMTASGVRLEWAGLDGPVVDKHSSGGVGDKVSLILAPVLAACGAFVPMLSGRGLGHTGGTLDKLDSIPGYRSQPDLDLFRRVVREAGCAIIGQTPDLAPADRRLYAIRDVTGTVESLPLLVSSILSKKLAAGLDALVMDVKVGSGAFLPGHAAARELAEALVEVAAGAGLPCRALMTDMSMCLGRTAGNALEVREAVDVLAGRAADPRLLEVTLALAGELLAMTGLAVDRAAGRVRAGEALASGTAAERFARMVRALGGPPDLLEHADRHLADAPLRQDVAPEGAGHVEAIDARALGLAVIELGGGRVHPEDDVDPAVGLSEVAAEGEAVGPGRPLAVIHARSEEQASRAAARLQRAFVIAREPPPERRLILDLVGAAKTIESP
ncbi:MAG TPA: thymidine phosphorylase [Geminicoccaceae bacterium]